MGSLVLFLELLIILLKVHKKTRKLIFYFFKICVFIEKKFAFKREYTHILLLKRIFKKSGFIFIFHAYKEKIIHLFWLFDKFSLMKRIKIKYFDRFLCSPLIPQ